MWEGDSLLKLTRPCQPILLIPINVIFVVIDNDGMIIGLKKVTDDMKTHKNPGTAAKQPCYNKYTCSAMSRLTTLYLPCS